MSEAARKVRVQTYLDPKVVEAVKQRALEGRRPDSWEVEYLLRIALQSEGVEL
jgi:hypothetical protein